MLKLPAVEQKYFRPAVFRDAIGGGNFRDLYHVFLPYQDGILVFSTENTARKSLPVFFEYYLDPRREQLQRRSGVGDPERPWWALSRFYKWVQKGDPRILSKYFGAQGDFVIDEESRIVPVQGYAWYLRSGFKSLADRDIDVTNAVLLGYSALLNSRTFSRLLDVFSESVQGGQFNLSARFVRPIPLPDLSSVEYIGHTLELVSLARASDRFSPTWQRAVENIASALWGLDLVSALSELDDA
jgi:adenine-specific DNA-methyltransferase